MPSGYTSKLYEGKDQTPKEFIADIATAFCIGGERDYGDGSENVERERKYLREALQELADLEAMDADAKEQGAMKSYFQQLDSWVESRKWSTPIRLRYEKMKRAVLAWAPTHEGGKKVQEFAVEQLDASIDFDCTDYPREVPEMQDPDEWYDERVEWANRRFLRAQTNLVEAITRHEKAVAWRAGYEADYANL